MPKSVVFIGHYNGGKDDFDTRHFFFAKELVGLGYKTTIINAAFSHRIHDAKLIDNQYIYEKLTVEACLEGNYRKALQALTLNRTVINPEKAALILEDMMKVNKKYWELK